MFKNHFLNIIE